MDEEREKNKTRNIPNLKSGLFADLPPKFLDQVRQSTVTQEYEGKRSDEIVADEMLSAGSAVETPAKTAKIDPTFFDKKKAELDAFPPPEAPAVPSDEPWIRARAAMAHAVNPPVNKTGFRMIVKERERLAEAEKGRRIGDEVDLKGHKGLMEVLRKKYGRGPIRAGASSADQSAPELKVDAEVGESAPESSVTPDETIVAPAEAVLPAVPNTANPEHSGLDDLTKVLEPNAPAESPTTSEPPTPLTPTPTDDVLKVDAVEANELGIDTESSLTLPEVPAPKEPPPAPETEPSLTINNNTDEVAPAAIAPPVVTALPPVVEAPVTPPPEAAPAVKPPADKGGFGAYLLRLFKLGNNAGAKDVGEIERERFPEEKTKPKE